MKNHRCEGSLKAKISIRYCRLMEGYNLDMDWNIEAWRLFNRRFDYDYDCYHENHVAKIEYCPFCGEKFR